MKNPRTWAGPTSWSHKGLNDKSGPDKNLSAHGRKEVKASSMEFPDVIPHSGTGRPALGQGSTMMGMPHPMSSDRSEMPTNKMGMHPKIEKSATMVPKGAKSWKKKNYDMSVPADMTAGKKIAAKMKAH